MRDLHELDVTEQRPGQRASDVTSGGGGRVDVGLRRRARRTSSSNATGDHTATERVSREVSWPLRGDLC